MKRPSRDEIAAAADKLVDDVIADDLTVLFCGINPGLYTAAVGHHFARPGNRFWPALHKAGYTPYVLSPHEERRLLEWGYGITNIVARATARADEVSRRELEAGAAVLEAKMARFRPRALAILGVTAYRAAFGEKATAIGPQTRTIGGVPVWVLPNPSGLNAHYQLDDLAELYREVRLAAERR